MVYNDYTKLRILYYLHQGKRPPTIALLLQKEGIEATRKGVAGFEKRFLATGTIARCQGSGRKTVITDEIQQVVETQMRRDDEATASQLHHRYTGVSISMVTCTVSRAWLPAELTHSLEMQKLTRMNIYYYYYLIIIAPSN